MEALMGFRRSATILAIYNEHEDKHGLKEERAKGNFWNHQRKCRQPIRDRSQCPPGQSNEHPCQWTAIWNCQKLNRVLPGQWRFWSCIALRNSKSTAQKLKASAEGHNYLKCNLAIRFWPLANAMIVGESDGIKILLSDNSSKCFQHLHFDTKYLVSLRPLTLSLSFLEQRPHKTDSRAPSRLQSASRLFPIFRYCFISLVESLLFPIASKNNPFVLIIKRNGINVMALSCKMGVSKTSKFHLYWM